MVLVAVRSCGYRYRDLQETVGYWKARTEVQNLAIADRARQREESEKAMAEGTWTYADCEEPETGPDSELSKMEAEMKIEARRRVIEDAEAQGLPCFYPDGSFRKGELASANSLPRRRRCLSRGPLRRVRAGLRSRGPEERLSNSFGFRRRVFCHNRRNIRASRSHRHLRRGCRGEVQLRALVSTASSVTSAIPAMSAVSVARVGGLRQRVLRIASCSFRHHHDVVDQVG